MCLFEIVCVQNPLVKIVFSFNDIQDSMCTIFPRDIIYMYQYSLSEKSTNLFLEY